MSTDNLRAIKSVDGEYIPLTYIESMNNSRIAMNDEAQAIINVLKDDIHIRVTTRSGCKYVCSMLEIKQMMIDEKIHHPAPTSAQQCFDEFVYPSWVATWRANKR